MLSNTVEACKTQFVNQVKEGDFVRWGNTKRVTGLRRADLEAGWDGLVQGEWFVLGGDSGWWGIYLGDYWVCGSGWLWVCGKYNRVVVRASCC